jgi:hypothetical protein
MPQYAPTSVGPLANPPVPTTSLHFAICTLQFTIFIRFPYLSPAIHRFATDSPHLVTPRPYQDSPTFPSSRFIVSRFLSTP